MIGLAMIGLATIGTATSSGSLAGRGNNGEKIPTTSDGDTVLFAPPE